MKKSESIGNLTSAVIAVNQEVGLIEKNLTVGEGSIKYKGVADKDVKHIIGKAMARNGLAIFPSDVQEASDVHRWVVNDKPKMQVLVRVTTRYILAHASGEWIEIVGYGHGIDTQDKAAGKATTYALKYALLYQFLIPTGDIDDADNTPPAKDEAPTKKEKEVLNQMNPKWADAVVFLRNNGNLDVLLDYYSITESDINELRKHASQG